MKRENKKIIFVYNADGGLMGSTLDVIHKVVSPSTYQCSLCTITYGALTEKKEWKSFRKNLKIPTEFLHKDKFEKQYKTKAKKYPVVFLEKEGKVRELIRAEEINACKNINDLKTLVKMKTKQAL